MKFRIEIELSNLPLGSKGKFAEKLGTSRQAISDIYKRGKPTFRTMEKHTEAFNELAGTNYIYTYLFSEIKEENET